MIALVATVGVLRANRTELTGERRPKFLFA